MAEPAVKREFDEQLRQARRERREERTGSPASVVDLAQYRASRQAKQTDIDQTDRQEITSAGRIRQAARVRLQNLKAAPGKKIREFVPDSTWYAILILALTKDLLDMISLDLLSWLDWVVDILLGFLLYLVSGRDAAARLKNLQTSILTAVAEIIPLVGLLPIWSISVYFLWQREKAKQLEEEQ